MGRLLHRQALGFDACPFFVSEDIDADGVVEFAFVEAEGRFVSLFKADTWRETWRCTFGTEGGPGVTYLVEAFDPYDGGGRKIIAGIGRSLHRISAAGRVERTAAFPERIVKCVSCRTPDGTGFYASFEGGTVRLLTVDFDVTWQTDFRGTFEDHAPLYIGDIDGDGCDEAVVSLTDRRWFYVVDEDSRILWDRAVPEGDTHLDSVVIDDIDGDGSPELVTSTRGTCFDADGAIRWQITPEMGLTHGQEVHVAKARTDIEGKQVFLFDSRRPTPSCMLADCRGSILWRREFPRQICPCHTIRWRANEVSFSVCEQIPRPERGPFHAWILDNTGEVRDVLDFESEPCAAVMYHDWTGCSNTNEVDVDDDGAEELALLSFDSRLYIFNRGEAS